LFDKQNAFPKQVNEALFVPQLLDRLFKGGKFASLNPKGSKEIVVKALCLPTLIAGIFPFFGESGGVYADLPPG